MRRGQAAIEFLTTYGWAFMIILVVSGGLVYFGVFNVSGFVPDVCDFGNEIFCPLHALNYDEAAGTFDVHVQLSNNAAERIEIDSMSIKDVSGTAYCNSSGVALPPTGPTIVSSTDSTFTFEFTDGNGCNFANSFLGPESKRKYDVRLYYREEGASMKTSVKGKIVGIAS